MVSCLLFYTANPRCKFFSDGKDPFQEGTKHLIEMFPLKVYQFPLMYKSHTWDIVILFSTIYMLCYI